MAIFDGEVEFEKIRDTKFRLSLRGGSERDNVQRFLDSWKCAKSAAEYWYCLVECVLEADNFKSLNSELLKHFRGEYCRWPGTSAAIAMFAYEAKKLSELPEIVQVYRGVGLRDFSRESVAGVSWTIDQGVAESFAEIAAGCNDIENDKLNDDPLGNGATCMGVVVGGKIQKRHILYYSHFGDEDEVVIDVDQLSDVRYVCSIPSVVKKESKNLSQVQIEELDTNLQSWFPFNLPEIK